MFNTTVIKKTVTGIMQSAGGFAEPITRALGLRARTAAGSAVEITHDDTDGKIESNAGKLVLVAVGNIETAQPFKAASIFSGGVQIPAPSTGDTASRPNSPVLGQEYFDTDLDDWIKWNGSAWRYFTGVDA